MKKRWQFTDQSFRPHQSKAHLKKDPKENRLAKQLLLMRTIRKVNLIAKLLMAARLLKRTALLNPFNRLREHLKIIVLKPQ
jgi:hypothetical protein